MYQIESSGQVLRDGRGPLWKRRVSSTVLLLGITSFFTDISSEMVSAILPLYLVLNLQLTPLAFGFIDGLYIGAAGLLRIVSGLFADRFRLHKETAFTGYALSALSRVGLLAVGSSWPALVSVVMVDRLGKGIRTSPRDALISLSSPKADLATAFGVHRALDTAGAMIGPLLAFVLLSGAPGAYDLVFVISLCIALVGLSVIGLFVPNHAPAALDTAAQSLQFRSVLSLMRSPALARLLLVGTLLSLATISDGFLYLTLQRRLEFSVGFFPLLYVGTALIYMLLAVPFGRLADTHGRARLFIGGYILLALIYVILLLPSLAKVDVLIALVLFGAYYAATDGVLMALASSTLETHMRASGLALLTTATSLMRLLASILFGLLWTWRGVEFALISFTLALAAAILVACLSFASRKDQEPLESRPA